MECEKPLHTLHALPTSCATETCSAAGSLLALDDAMGATPCLPSIRSAAPGGRFATDVPVTMQRKAGKVKRGAKERRERRGRSPSVPREGERPLCFLTTPSVQRADRIRRTP